MSSSFDTMIFYGFKAPNPVSRDRVSGNTTSLWEWLETRSGLGECNQINVGMSNGGYPHYYAGFVVVKNDDITRSIDKAMSFSPDDLVISEAKRLAIADAHEAISLLVPDELPGPIGWFLAGDIS